MVQGGGVVAVGALQRIGLHQGVDRHTAQHEEHQAQSREAKRHLLVERYRLHRYRGSLGCRHGELQVADVPRQVEDHIGGALVSLHHGAVGHVRPPGGGLGHVLGRDLDRGGVGLLREGQLEMSRAYGPVQPRYGDGDGASLLGGQGGILLTARYRDGLGGQVNGRSLVAAAQEMEGMEIADKQLAQKGQDEEDHRHPLGGVLAGKQDEDHRQQHEADEVGNHTDQGKASFGKATSPQTGWVTGLF